MDKPKANAIDKQSEVKRVQDDGARILPAYIDDGP